MIYSSSSFYLRRQIAVILLLVAAAGAQTSAKAAAPQLQVTNLMPEFWKYWDRADHADRATQIRLFKEMVIAPHPELYTHEVLKNPANITLDDDIGKFLDFIPPLIPQMRQLSGQLQSDLPKYVAGFMKAFPDYKPDTPIYFMVSLRAFDGAVRQVNGKPALLFGLDIIAWVHKPDDLPAFFDHELFHRYHAQAAHEDGDQIYLNLWQEGLATYVSHVLNPGISIDTLFAIPPDLQEKTRPHVKQIAGELLRNFDSTDDTTYRRYFMAGKSAPTDIPMRSGYYLGYLVAEDLAKTHSLSELAHLHGEELRAAVRGELQRLAK